MIPDEEGNKQIMLLEDLLMLRASARAKRRDTSF
jgi:hypothetical protein